MRLFKAGDSQYWQYDFTVREHRYRGSTKETNKHRAERIAALKQARALERHDPLPKKAPRLLEFCGEFLTWVDGARLDADTKRYYRNGVRLLKETNLMNCSLDNISGEAVESLNFPGSPSNGNNALRTLRRILTKAKERRFIGSKPTFRLLKERGRALNLNEDAERKLVPLAEQPLKDIIPFMRDTGLRNVRELLPMRVEHIDWTRRAFFIPDSKTKEGQRWVPLSDRAWGILKRRSGDRSEGWVWLSRYKGKHVGAAMVNRRWNRAREKAGLPKDLVLYCARHDFGTAVMKDTGNLKLIMEVMGQRDIATATRYQHPGMDLVRAVINARNQKVTAGFTAGSAANQNESTANA